MEQVSLDQLSSYWDSITPLYHDAVHITTNDFHYGPLVPGDSHLQLLPNNCADKRCLEVGCGAAQNSIFLARQGAACTAIDIAPKQIEEAAALSASEKVTIETSICAMEKLSVEQFGTFDLIHSSYALTFASDPKAVIKILSLMLNENGTLIFSTGHPLFTGEWLETDEENGLFISDYFNPQSDIRYDEDGNEKVRSNFFPVSELINWVADAGLRIEQVVEPKPIDISQIPEHALTTRIPYVSKGWLEYDEQLSHIPGIIIIKATKS